MACLEQVDMDRSSDFCSRNEVSSTACINGEAATTVANWRAIFDKGSQASTRGCKAK